MAVDLGIPTLQTELGIDSVTATRLLAVSTALVERYAPDAPEPIQNEAAIRCCGWLNEQPAAAVRSESVGDISAAYAPNMMGALRHSGAMALLSPWKIRRAGSI